MTSFLKITENGTDDGIAACLGSKLPALDDLRTV